MKIKWIIMMQYISMEKERIEEKFEIQPSM
jgi:hypothetical protein